MIRRIILFLGLLFILFFAYRRYDTQAADNFLLKVKNFSFSKSDTYTTTISDSSGSGTVVISGDVSGDLSGTARQLLQAMSAIVVDQNLAIGVFPVVATGVTTSSSEVTGTTSTKSSQGVVVSGIDGAVVIKTGAVETISAVSSSSTVSTTSAKPKATPPKAPATLSAEDKRDVEEFSQMFSN